MVWGGVSQHHQTELIVIAGNLNAVRYREDILLPHVVPFLQAHPDMTMPCLWNLFSLCLSCWILCSYKYLHMFKFKWIFGINHHLKKRCPFSCVRLWNNIHNVHVLHSVSTCCSFFKLINHCEESFKSTCCFYDVFDVSFDSTCIDVRVVRGTIEPLVPDH